MCQTIANTTTDGRTRDRAQGVLNAGIQFCEGVNRSNKSVLLRHLHHMSGFHRFIPYGYLPQGVLRDVEKRLGYDTGLVQYRRFAGVAAFADTLYERHLAEQHRMTGQR